MATACRLILLLSCLAEAGDLLANRWTFLYNQAIASLNRGEVESAGRIAGPAYHYWSRATGSPWHWPFRLVFAESLMEQDRTREAAPLLEGHAPAADWEARRLVDAAFIKYRGRDHSGALRDLASAEALNPLTERDVAGKIGLIRGMIDLREERRAEADATLRQALAAVAGTGSAVESLALAGLGVGDLRSYRNEEAVVWFERARTLAQRTGMKRAEMLADGNLGYGYQQLGDSEHALKFLDEAVTAATSLDDGVNLVRLLVNNGESAFQMGDSKKAEEYLKRARLLASPGNDDEWISTILGDLATFAITRGDLDSATSLNRESRAVVERLGQPRLQLAQHIQAAEIASLRNDYSGAETIYAAAEKMASNLGDPASLWHCHAGLASIYRGTGRAAEAAREYQLAIGIIDLQRSKLNQDDFKLTFLSHLIRFYGEYVDFLIDRGDVKSAFRVAQSSRARLLAEKAHQQDAAEPALDLTVLQREMQQSGAVLFSYWLGPRRSFVWTLDGSGLNVHTLPAEAEISQRVTRRADAIAKDANPLETADEAGQWLSANLIPESYRSRKGLNVVIQPDGSLHQLNFETLPAAGQRRFWIEDATVSIAPSLALLRASAVSPRGRLLLFGDPQYGGGGLPLLPNLKAEIDAVGKQFPEKRMLLGAEATPAAYEASHPGTYAVMHFAAHAVANRESPLGSAIVLSGPEDSRRLYARDVLDKPLTASLVTLSACETAGNRAYYGEGLMGFSWAFLSAGARNVVAGLWPVDDRATALLMESFYASLAAGNPPAAALRRAKLDLMASSAVYQKPRYWAAFETFTRALYRR
jgi:CHAT domain-containing protein